MKRTAQIFLVSFAAIGMFCLIYFTGTFIHEYIHYLDLKKEGVEISEFVLLGWKENVTSYGTLTSRGIAWIEPKEDYNRTKALNWDSAWCMGLCNLTSLKEYYGVK